jgi:fatty aldehyde-generating acyl-ACP reductase
LKKYAFIMHPLSLDEVCTFEPKAADKPEQLVEKMLEWLPPFVIGHRRHVISDHSEVEGIMICMPLLPQQILGLPADFVLNKLTEAAKLAEDNGASVIGLGAFTSVVGGRGKKLAQRLDLPVTTGSSFTAYSAVEALKLSAKRMKIDVSGATALVVGATGSIGGACAQLLGPQVDKIILAGRQISPPLERLAATIGANAVVTDDIPAALGEAKLILSATNAIGPVIEADKLLPGAIVCDVARPRDVAMRVSSRRDVLVIEGGVIRLPGRPEIYTDYRLDLGMPDFLTFACEAETILLALEGLLESFSLGRDMPLAKVKQIAAIGDRHGFELAGLRNFGQDISRADIRRIRRTARFRRLREKLKSSSKKGWAKAKARAAKATRSA